MKTIIHILFIAVLAFQIGCGNDPGRPQDLPKLYPVNITVTQEGNPLEGATVTLKSKEAVKYAVCSGTTNAAGVAVLLTYGYAGAPLGQYAVMIDKTGVEGAKEAINEEGLSYETGGAIYRYVDAQYWLESTPLSIDVTEKGAKETFDVGKPVRVFVSNNN